MLNELQRSEELLNGTPFKKEYFFSAYLNLIKYYHNKGFSALQIKEALEEWENKYGHKHYFDLNKAIMLVVKNDDFVFCDKVDINISQQDIDIINKRFDNANCRKTALALLCVAKHTNSDEIAISYPSLAQFTGLSYEMIKKKHVPEIVLFDYVEKINPTVSKWGWDDDKDMQKNYKQMRFKILVDYSNKGDFNLSDNNIVGLYDKIWK